MRIEPTNVTLHDGRVAVVRSLEPTDAQALLDQRRATSAETHFLVREPEEITQTAEEQARQIADALADPDDCMLAALVDGRLVGSASIMRVSPLAKLRHRAEFGISLLQEVCDLGLGTALLARTLEAARATSFDQIELGVCDDNPRARHVYEKAGFTEVGVQPRTFKLADGTYRDEVQMVYYLR